MYKLKLQAKKMHTKGQSAMEFVMLATLMFLFFGIMIIYLQNLLVDFTSTSKDNHVDKIQSAIVKEVAFANRMQTGYYREFMLPYTIQGLDYTVQIQSEAAPKKDAIIIVVEGKEYLTFIEADVSGTMKPGKNILQKTSSVIAS